MLKYIDNPKKTQQLFLHKDSLGFVVQAEPGTRVGHCGPQMLPDSRLLIKCLKCVWQGAPYMKYRLVVPWLDCITGVSVQILLVHVM